MDKFGRNYQLRVQTQYGDTLPLSLPFTLEFDITRKTMGSANVGQFRIYNLSKINRDLLRFNISNYGTFRSIELRAGYGDNLAVIFKGNISQAWSVREGVNFITQIECYDGGYAFNNSKTNLTISQGTSQSQVIETLMGDLDHVELGAVGFYPTPLPKGNSYSGPTTNLLNRELTSGSFFIDNGVANALNSNEYIADLNGISVINSQSGLLGTPVLEETIVRFGMLFEPNLQLGQRILLDSITENNFNHYYKVIGIKHRGVISDAICGEAITTGEFFFSETLTGVL